MEITKDMYEKVRIYFDKIDPAELYNDLVENYGLRNMIRKYVEIPDGLHYLSGIENIRKYGMDGVRFTLSGQSYECFENESDGYRSYGELLFSDEVCKYNFPPQPVNTTFKDTGYDWSLTMFDPVTENVILKIGTINYDDWYPVAVFEYNPENMSINNK